MNTKDKQSRGKIAAALRAAFPFTIPILAGFTFLGIAYGFYMHAYGFSAVYPILMSLTIFAGSMEFVTGRLLLAPFAPVGAFFLTLMVNAIHLFYGISMLDKYKDTGKKRWYLIFGMCDESFSINCTANIPDGIDKGWFMFFVTLLNQCYWVLGATLGGLAGNFIRFNTKGLDFVMIALFVVIFMEQWEKERNHTSGLIGLSASLLCLLIFGSENFIIPSMIAILLILTSLRPKLEKNEEGDAQ